MDSTVLFITGEYCSVLCINSMYSVLFILGVVYMTNVLYHNTFHFCNIVTSCTGETIVL